MLTEQELTLMDAYWRAANYISVGQVYLLDNPLLKEPLKLEHIKPRLLGHFGTTPGLNLVYVHMNRAIKKFDLNAIFITGPGHGGPALVANAYLEGSYCEFYPHITQDEEGLKHLFKQFSFPGGIPSHAAADTPGSIHEGGELGYSLCHAFGAAFDNPDLFVCCVVGDGEAETGALATSWHSNKFLNPKTDGAVLPILHLNGYKIANPTVLARISHKELEELMKGYGYKPYFVEGDDPKKVHVSFSATLDIVIQEIKEIQRKARMLKEIERPLWPMIILKTPKGWTGPKIIDGLQIENSWRSHQVPITDFKEKKEHIQELEKWLKSYRPEELFDKNGKIKEEIQKLSPLKEKRMGASPYANGGLLLKPLKTPELKEFAIKIKSPGKELAESTRILGNFLKKTILLNQDLNHFRIFGPDETASNRLSALFDVTNRVFWGNILPTDDHEAHSGRVMEVLSEHLCQGWLEGYLLTGRHGFFSCYEAFIHIIDSMFNQHAKWLKASASIPWRKPIASLNYLLTSHVWRQDHNGFSHQDPGFIDHVCNKKASIVRVYLPPDANTLLSVADHCLKSRNYVNVIVAGKQPELQYLNIDDAILHCKRGVGIWQWASNCQNEEPDLVMACCGDVPTLETLAAVDILRKQVPSLKVRVVNVVDLMVLEPPKFHPHGLSSDEFDALFTKDKPILFAFHGYPNLIHRLTYRCTNHQNLHVNGYREEGTTTTPFDMVVLNRLDRFTLVKDALKHTHVDPKIQQKITEEMDQKLKMHKEYIQQRGEDLPEVQNWVWD